MSAIDFFSIQVATKPKYPRKLLLTALPNLPLLPVLKESALVFAPTFTPFFQISLPLLLLLTIQIVDLKPLV
ncbi:hypothetical protein [Tolypothrix sp. VBCCA 56010]|uniref:hypothetical protein n=1 Tax=Tolypothrix sp. VBCCA 56010 TaxID=3137731 RepID=UPI003D7C9CF9